MAEAPHTCNGPCNNSLMANGGFVGAEGRRRRGCNLRKCASTDRTALCASTACTRALESGREYQFVPAEVHVWARRRHVENWRRPSRGKRVKSLSGLEISIDGVIIWSRWRSGMLRSRCLSRYSKSVSSGDGNANDFTETENVKDDKGRCRNLYDFQSV